MSAARRARRSPAARAGLAAVLALALPAAHAEQLVVAAAADNAIFADNADFSNGAGSLFIANIASGSPRRTLLRFDLATLPANGQVTAATVRFYINRAAIGSGPAEPAALHRLLASWGEGTSNTTAGTGTQATPTDTTWLYRSYGNPGAGIPRVNWATPGGDFVAAPSASTTIGSIGSYTVASTPQLVADIQAWQASPATNFGWILIGPEGGDQNARRIDSRESPAPANRPTLTITYTPGAADDAEIPLPTWLVGTLGAAMAGAGARRLRKPSARSA